MGTGESSAFEPSPSDEDEDDEGEQNMINTNVKH